MKRHLFTPVVTPRPGLTTAADARAEGDCERVLQRGTDSATGAEVTVAHGDPIDRDRRRRRICGRARTGRAGW
jgi:hypothetical protein